MATGQKLYAIKDTKVFSSPFFAKTDEILAVTKNQLLGIEESDGYFVDGSVYVSYVSTDTNKIYYAFAEDVTNNAPPAPKVNDGSTYAKIKDIGTTLVDSFLKYTLVKQGQNPFNTNPTDPSADPNSSQNPNNPSTTTGTSTGLSFWAIFGIVVGALLLFIVVIISITKSAKRKKEQAQAAATNAPKSSKDNINPKSTKGLNGTHRSKRRRN